MGDDDQWEFSREGDLDPDLTEEAGYSDWEPPRRRVLSIVLSLVTLLLIVALILPVVLRALAA